MGNTFVLPDGMAEEDMDFLVQPNPLLRGSSDFRDSLASSNNRPIQLKLDTLCQAVQSRIAISTTNSQRDISSALLSAVHETIENGLSAGRLPLTTWKEIEEELGPLQQGMSDDAAQHDVLDMFLKDDGEAIVMQLGRRSPNESMSSLVSLSQLTRLFSELWLEPLEGRISEAGGEARRGWVADLAREAFLATSGVMVQDTRLLGVGSDDNALDSSQYRSSSVAIKSSQSVGSGIPSSPVSFTSTNADDAAIRRLQLLAPSLVPDRMRSAKPSSVLSYWPTERGVSTEDYVSSVAVASDKQFDAARQRLQKIESRRKAQAEKYKVPAFMRQGVSQVSRRKAEAPELPALPKQPRQVPALPKQPRQVPAIHQALSSQQRVPESSQSMSFPGPSVTMSQPVPGMFGDRKKAKKAKRKSGFR
ncbi:hypothetical protein QQX98_000792 [Neonectria punicea]|uniref:Uncharacterized protein n=1 Tax=Neonectria punicea TaxID=979145 RepID=A0ABR1HSS8_9HYPO